MPDERGFLWVDMTGILEKYQELDTELTDELAKAAQSLAIQADAKIREWATERLHARRQPFLDGLSVEQINKNTFAVVIDKKAVWIEDGSPPHSMLEDLLSSSKAKTTKSGPNKGKKYLIVPFKQSKPQSQSSDRQKQLMKVLKKALVKRNISSSTSSNLDRNSDGSPKLGLVHSFDVATPSLQERRRSARKGETARTETPEGRSFLQGVRVYQKEVTDKKGAKSVQRSIFTFRVASQDSTGWNHPGNRPQNFLEEAHAWVQKTWDEEVGPAILRKLGLE